MSKHSALMPEDDRYDRFVKGDSPLGTGRFWMVNLLKFKEGGAHEYRKYADAVIPLMDRAGGRCIFRLYDHVATVIDGGGLVPDWDGVFVGEYPSPAAYAAFATSEAYRKAHNHRAAALEATEMYACQAFWTSSASASWTGPQAEPNWDMDLSMPRRLAAEKKHDKAAMMAIGEYGKSVPEKIMRYAQDDRFASGRIWMLNLLKYESGDKAKYYYEYYARAQSHISGTMQEGSGGGVQMASQKVFALLGPEYDNIAIMQYPSKEAFFGYASGSDRKGNAGMSDGFMLRTAGLAVQGLVCLAPEADAEAVQDPNGPKVQPTSRL